MKLVLFIIEIAFIIWVRKFAEFLRKYLSERSLMKRYENSLKEEYERYKQYLFDEKELQLDQPKRLQVNIESASSFSNNAELRHVFMQIALYIRLCHIADGTNPNPEIENIFSEIRTFAYANGEDVINL